MRIIKIYEDGNGDKKLISMMKIIKIDKVSKVSKVSNFSIINNS